MVRTVKYLTLFLLLTLAGCIRSLYPLFTESDLYFMPSLIGTWISEEGKDAWTFTKEGEASYILHHYQAEFEEAGGDRMRGDTVMFLAQLGKLDKYFFLDIYPDKPETNIKNSFYNYHLLPVHTISRLWLEGDTLKLSMLDSDWLEKMIDNNAFKIDHARPNDQLILTASTEELQALVIRNAENKKAFPNPGVLYRMK